ncbi:MAG: glycoside hydrolase family 25 protein [Coprococcus sp.]
MDTQQIKKFTRNWCILVGSVCLIAGIVIGIFIGRAGGFTNSKASPGLSYESGYTLEDTEITSLIYDNYWNYIPTAYINVGELGPDALLYKISDKVERNNLDVEKFYTGDDGYMHYSDDNIKDTLVGVDLSTFQSDIDWETLAKNKDIDFVMLRVGYRGYTQGGLMLDSSFEDSKAAVIKYKIPTGLYFFTQAITLRGVEEANFVLKQIGKMNVKYPMIDSELIGDSEARGDNASNDERTDGIVGFCETIKAAGYTPMIYASRNMFAQCLDMDRLGDYELWLAHYANVPNFPYKYTGWQYTESGTVDGISGDVDLDLWFK